MVGPQRSSSSTSTTSRSSGSSSSSTCLKQLLVLGCKAALMVLGVSRVEAAMVGSAKITPHDYIGLGPALLTNPPSCGMPYATLDISRITAVQAMDKSFECGTCLKVYNTLETDRFIYVLAVDTGGQGLDISIPSFDKLFGQKTDPAPASWAPTDSSNCKDIYLKNLLPEKVVATVEKAVDKLPYPISKVLHGNKDITVQSVDENNDNKSSDTNDDKQQKDQAKQQSATSAATTTTIHLSNTNYLMGSMLATPLLSSVFLLWTLL
ncbi:hypothetical protein BDF22DRAFT_742969 [Syncephalis plumigaleata]|nr:hypothetical protein BDF22DRAFT_742969 [Syncephalis plumigaleata]